MGSRRLLSAATLLLLLPGTALLLVGIASVRLLEHGLVDWRGDGSGIWSPLALTIHLAEFASRSMLTAAVAGDLLARADSAAPPS